MYCVLYDYNCCTVLAIHLGGVRCCPGNRDIHIRPTEITSGGKLTLGLGNKLHSITQHIVWG